MTYANDCDGFFPKQLWGMGEMDGCAANQMTTFKKFTNRITAGTFCLPLCWRAFFHSDAAYNCVARRKMMFVCAHGPAPCFAVSVRESPVRYALPSRVFVAKFICLSIHAYQCSLHAERRKR